MLAIDRTEHRSSALERVRDLANELARSHPNAKGLVRELFLAFTAVYEEAREPGDAGGTQAASAALLLIREAVEAVAPNVLPSRDFIAKFYGPEPIHEAQAIAEALRGMFAADERERELVLPGWDEFKPRRD